jgi:hypothetical protein
VTRRKVERMYERYVSGSDHDATEMT